MADTCSSKDPAGATLFPLAPVHLAALAVIQAALGLCFVDPLWSLLLVAAFLLFCFLVAPFVQTLQFFLPIVTRGERGTGSVALTFDDGPDPLTTPLLLDLLEEKGLKAAFFVLGKKVREYPELTRQILERGHEIGNHSQSHDVFLMLRSFRRLRRDVRDGQKTLEPFGVRPVAFRPPVGVTNPRLWRVLLESGMYCAGFRRRAGDMGNLRVRGIARRILKRLSPGDVILLHDCRPWKAKAVGDWLREVRELMEGIESRGLAVRPLSQVIRRPVMEPLNGAAPDPVRTFYNTLSFVEPPENRTPAARAEEAWFRSLEGSIRPDDRVLEIGAGTGRFTIPLARRAREVCAVDISLHSLEILRKRAHENGVKNVHTLAGDIRMLPDPGRFQVVCSFSAFEYFPDLRPLLEAVVLGLEPGGRLCFSTAHRSFFRLFAQIGNAMRQGIWLHARTRGQVEGLLRSLDMEEISISTVGMKSWFGTGLVLTATARKKRSKDPTGMGAGGSTGDTLDRGV